MATMSGWTEAAVLAIVTVIAFSFVIADMNLGYGVSSAQTPIPFTNETMGFLSESGNYTESGQQGIQGATVSFDAVLGMNWKNAWAMIKLAVSMIWNFINGSWISTILQNVFYNFPGINLIAIAVRILFLIGLVYAVIRIVTKVRP